MNRFLRGVSLYLLVAIIFIAIISTFYSPSEGKRQVEYWQFLRYLESGQLVSVKIIGEQKLEGVLRDNTTFVTHIPPNNTDLLRRLEDAVEYIEGLLADVVTLLRAGAPAEPPRPVLLAPLVREVAEALAIPAPALTIALPDQPVWGYPRQLRQLFSNLLENAVKYARPDVPLRLWVTGEARHGLLTVRLCDNGRGVPAEHLERIFEPFYRLALPESEDPGGSGIGLAVARRIVGAHGGTIRALPADHGPGLCLEMTFLLAGGEEPLVRPAALPGRPPAAPQPAERPARASGVGGM